MPQGVLDIFELALRERVLETAIAEVLQQPGPALTEAETAALVEILSSNLLAAAQAGETNPARLKAKILEGVINRRFLN
ncbi:MAG: hypothetical protein JWN11_1979 [Hyphomicrobiales bacterium]|nr:hypothetical protein [Hyphomicrobiales bacterium]